MEPFGRGTWAIIHDVQRICHAPSQSAPKTHERYENGKRLEEHVSHLLVSQRSRICYDSLTAEERIVSLGFIPVDGQRPKAPNVYELLTVTVNRTKVYWTVKQ